MRHRNTSLTIKDETDDRVLDTMSAVNALPTQSQIRLHQYLVQLCQTESVADHIAETLFSLDIGEDTKKNRDARGLSGTAESAALMFHL